MKAPWMCSLVLVSSALLAAPLVTAQTENPAKPPADQPLTADAIVSRMQSTYADCKSYRDEGEVSSVYLKKDGQQTQRKPFKTWFVRPKLFRFEFQDQAGPGAGKWTRYVVWADGQKIRTWWSVLARLKEFDSIESALAGPTGVSGGSAVNIPGLLMTEMQWGSGLRRLADAKLLGTEKIGDAECYKIDAGAKTDASRRQTLWIDRKTFLIRRLAERKELGDVTVEQTTDYKPEMNVAIPEAEFQFEPPDVKPEAGQKKPKEEAADKKP